MPQLRQWFLTFVLVALARPATAQDVTTGLIGYWKLNETSGTTAADSSSYAAAGTVNGGANWSTRCNGVNDFDFNGSSNFISVPNAPQLQPTAALTIAGWVRGDAWGSGSNVRVILRKGAANSTNYQLAIAAGRVALYLDERNNRGTRSNAVLSTNRWYHVAATWDGSTIKIYIDGQLDKSVARAGTIGTDTSPLYIGGRPGANQFNGMMYDVRFYNRALLPTEITALAGVSGVWKFNEGTGSTAADSSGIGNNATLSGGASWTTDCPGNNFALLTNGSGGIAKTATPFAPPSVGTVAFWMRGSGPLSARGRLFGVNGDWEVRQETSGTLSFDLGGSPYVGNEPFSTVDPVDANGEWYHVAALFDDADNSYSVYLNGALRASGVSPVNLVPQSPGILSFGTRTGSTEYWLGALRDFRVYSRKLCPAEIGQIYGLIGNWKLDETVGSTAADSSLLGNNGTYQGGVSLAASSPVPGSGALAAVFDGTNGHVPVPNESEYDVTGPISVAAWINVASFTKARQAILTKGNSAWRLSRRGRTNFIQFVCSGLNPNQVNGTKNVNDGGWHHLVGVYDGSSLTLYVDGVVDGSVSSSGSIAMNNYDVEIGGNDQASGLEFHGAIYDARVYSRALCPAEVQALSSGGSGASGVRIIKWVELQ